MTLRSLLFAALAAGASLPGQAEVPENFRRANLVAWCVVPFDAKQRGPVARSEMLSGLGLKRCAYDWRERHVPEFEEEIRAYQTQGIEFFAFWNEHDAAFALFREHGLTPQVWKTLRSPPKGAQAEMVARAVAEMEPLAKKTAALGSKLGLYNHGGWGGEPANLVAVCEALHERGHRHVGIVYNFHHGHGHIEGFAQSLAAMKPHLLCLNLNGMCDPEEVKARKIIPIGSGEHEKAMIAAVLASGYEGPIGIIGHRTDEDVAVTLRKNLAGLDRILAELAKR